MHLLGATIGTTLLGTAIVTGGGVSECLDPEGNGVNLGDGDGGGGRGGGRGKPT
jgi:hypothetical protein